MIYTKSNTFLENCYKSLEKARDEYSSINENAYTFLYESEYNLNCMMNEINIMESKAKSQGCTLILEAADLKTIFSNIGKWIVKQVDRFIKWIQSVVERITSLFKKKDKIENFEEKREEIKDQEVVDVDTDKINQMAQDIQSDFDKRIQDIESASTEEELTKIESDIKSGPNGEKLTAATEEELGLNNKTTVGEKYKSEKDLESNEAKVKGVINNVAKAATSVRDKSTKALDKKSSEVSKDEMADEAKIEVKRASLYSAAANEALVKATAVSKAILIDEDQKKKIADQLMKHDDELKLFYKRLDIYRRSKPNINVDNEREISFTKRFINKIKNKDNKFLKSYFDFEDDEIKELSDSDINDLIKYEIFYSAITAIKKFIHKTPKIINGITEFVSNKGLTDLSKEKSIVKWYIDEATKYIDLNDKNKNGKPYFKNMDKLDNKKVDDQIYYKRFRNYLEDYEQQSIPTDINWVYDAAEFEYFHLYNENNAQPLNTDKNYK